MTMEAQQRFTENLINLMQYVDNLCKVIALGILFFLLLYWLNPDDDGNTWDEF